MISSGTCFGYAISSPLGFGYLRDGDGTRLDIDCAEEERAKPTGTPLVEWPARAGQPFAARLDQEAAAYTLWIDQVAWFRIDPRQPAIQVSPSFRASARESSLWGIPMALCFMGRGDLGLHAAAVEVNDSAVLLAGPGHFGKTTLAAAFFQAGHRLLSEDISCCRLSPEPAVIPGPALLRLRRDSYAELGLPGTMVVREDPDRVHLAVDRSLRGTSEPVPLKAIVFLHPTDGPVRLERADALASLPDLWSVSLRFPTDVDSARCFADISTLTTRVASWHLFRPNGFGALPAVVERIMATCGLS